MVGHSSHAVAFSARLNQLIRDFYEGSALVPLSQYRRWALCELQREIGFSRAAWGSGSYESDRIHSLRTMSATLDASDALRAGITLQQDGTGATRKAIRRRVIGAGVTEKFNRRATMWIP